MIKLEEAVKQKTRFEEFLELYSRGIPDKQLAEAGFRVNGYYRKNNNGNIEVSARDLPIISYPPAHMLLLMNTMTDSLLMPQVLPWGHEDYVPIEKAKKSLGII